ncbi:MAG: hypothetical protein V1845_01225 [bacterium]
MLWQIPILMRWVKIGKGLNSAPIVIDNIGILVRYDELCQLEEKFVLRHQPSVSPRSCVIAAQTPEEAIAKFMNDFLGAGIGGDAGEEKIFWIDQSRYIIQLPPCRFMKVSGLYHFTCAKVDRNDKNNGACVLNDQNLPAPKNCRIRYFLNKVRAKIVNQNVSFNVVSVKGVIYPVLFTNTII